MRHATTTSLLFLASACASPAPALDLDAGAATGDVAVVGSRCVVTADAIACMHETTSIGGREVHYQVPLGSPPAEGWPVAFFFQGSLFSNELSWSGTSALPITYRQAQVIQHLLDAGFAVIAPEATLDGHTGWFTNVPPYTTDWESSADHVLVVALLQAIDTHVLGMLDPARLYGTGISSGGYMTSRMAVSYAGRFKALAVQSASYATCLGPVCSVPELAPDHAPTLLLHGGLDTVVPLWTARRYRYALADGGIEHELIIDGAAGHEWIAAAPAAVLDWFQRFP